MLTRNKPGHASSNIEHWFRKAASFVLLTLFLAALCTGQDDTRKVIARTAPTYPDIARRMRLSGKVKIEVTVTPAGTVKAAKMVGGNPVFEQNALAAVKQWKFETASKESKVAVLLEFAEQ